MDDRERSLKEQIIIVGKRLYDTGIAVARSGNISGRCDENAILITATGTSLGNLLPADIVRISMADGASSGERKPSSELPLHSLIYKNFPCTHIIHAHPPLSNGYFAVMDSLKALTFETSFYLGDVPVVPQSTPTVTDPALVIEALASSNIVVLKNHGVVAMGPCFDDALSLIEALEEAVKSAAIARLFNKDAVDALGMPLKENLMKEARRYSMFSRPHIAAIVELVNKDEFILNKGRELDLTVRLAIVMDGSDNSYCFNFEKGRITQLDENADAPFVISAGKEVWALVFSGKLDPFVAVTQGKMKLAGQLGQLSRWYVPFSRLFQIFKQVDFL
jgi:L-fuculose-phosphate aldolase